MRTRLKIKNFRTNKKNVSRRKPLSRTKENSTVQHIFELNAASWEILAIIFLIKFVNVPWWENKNSANTYFEIIHLHFHYKYSFWWNSLSNDTKIKVCEYQNDNWNFLIYGTVINHILPGKGSWYPVDKVLVLISYGHQGVQSCYQDL